MNYLRKNLKYLRSVFGVKQEEVGQLVNKQRSAIGNWESGLSEPSLDDLITLSSFFSIRLDILVLADIEKKQLISGKHIEEFAKKGKLKQNPVDYDTINEPPAVIEEEEIQLSNVMDKLERINDNIRKLRNEINARKK